MKVDRFLQQKTSPKNFCDDKYQRFIISFPDTLVSIAIGVLLSIFLILILYENLALGLESQSLYFGNEVNVSKNIGASELPQVSAEGNNVYVVWQDNTTGNYDIYIKSSSTNGINFKSMRNLSKNNGASELAQIEPYKDVFYIVWKDSTGSMERIFFKEGRKDISTNNTEFGSTKKISSIGNVTRPSITSGSAHISAAWISNFANGSVIGYYPINFFLDSNNAVQLTKLLPRDSIGSVGILSYNTETYCVWESKEIANSEIIFKRISTAYFE